MAEDTLTQSTNGTASESTPLPRVAGPSAVEIAEAITATAAGVTGPPPPTQPVVDKHPMGPKQRGTIGGSIVLLSALLMTQLLAIWPAVVAASALKNPHAVSSPLLFGLVHMTFDMQSVLIVMVLMIGALGALVGSSRRFLYFASRDELTKRDEWSYLIRPMQGAALALIVYFTLRGGYLGQDQSAPVNPYGVAALSALVGLFTRHAVSKLTDVFDTLFGEPKEDESPVEVKAGTPSDDAVESM